MARYTSNKKISEMKPSKKINKKAWGMFLSGVAVVSMVSGFAYSTIKDDLQHNDEIRNNKIEYEMNPYASSTPVLSKHLKDNKKIIDELKGDLLKYQGYFNMSNRSEKTEKEMENLIDKLSSEETLNTVSHFALDTVKAKMADAYKLKDYSDIKVRVSNDPESPRSYGIVNSKTNELLFRPDINVFFGKSDGEKMQLHQTVEKIIALQNAKADKNSKFDKTKYANLVYGLYNSAIKTANTKYIAKNGKLMEVGEPKVVTPTLTQKVKDNDDERGL